MLIMFPMIKVTRNFEVLLLAVICGLTCVTVDLVHFVQYFVIIGTHMSSTLDNANTKVHDDRYSN